MGGEPGSENDRADFFVSYTAVDVAWAEWAAYVLEAAGFSTILQAWDFMAGSNFVLKMNDALRRSDRVMPLLSEPYLESAFGTAEWAAAFATDPTGDAGRLIPVRVGPCHPEGLLSTTVYVDLVGRNEPEAKRLLLAGARRSRNKPASQPPFPGSDGAARRPPPYPGEHRDTPPLSSSPKSPTLDRHDAVPGKGVPPHRRAGKRLPRFSESNRTLIICAVIAAFGAIVAAVVGLLATRDNSGNIPATTTTGAPATTLVPGITSPAVPGYELNALQTQNAAPSGITLGPDRRLWFTEQLDDSIWAFAPGKPPARVAKLAPGSHPFEIITGPDGNLWFTQGQADGTSADAIGRIRPDGTQLRDTSLPPNSQPTGLSKDAAGNVWVTAYAANAVYRLGPGGEITGGPFPVPNNPNRIVQGPDGGDMWVTEALGSKVVVLSKDDGHIVRQYDVEPHPTVIVVGPDKDLWFTSHDSNAIQRIDPRSDKVLPPISIAGGPGGLVVGGDGNLWITELSVHAVSVIPPDAVDATSVKRTVLPGGTPFGICTDADGRVWFTVQGDRSGNSDAIGRITTP